MATPTTSDGSGIVQWLRHAFAVAPDAAPPLTPAETALIDRVCVELVRRRLALPALVLLEAHRPLSSMAAQVVWFVKPWCAAVTDAAGLDRLAQLLERRDGMDLLLARLQAAEHAASAAPREGVASGE